MVVEDLYIFVYSAPYFDFYVELGCVSLCICIVYVRGDDESVYTVFKPLIGEVGQFLCNTMYGFITCNADHRVNTPPDAPLSLCFLV